MRLLAESLLVALLAAQAHSADIKPAAEVSASKGPIQLTLRLLETRFKHGFGKNPWYQLELKNVGKKPIKVVDPAFFDDPYEIRDRIDSLEWIALELRPADGDRKLRVAPRLPDQRESSGYPPRLRRKKPSAIDAKVAEADERWSAEGLPVEERLQRGARLRAELEPVPTSAERVIWLNPGTSTTTASERNWLDPEPLIAHSGYAEFDAYLLPPGRYRIRAIYDLRFMNKWPEGRRPEWDATLKTPFISFVVEP